MKNNQKMTLLFWHRKSKTDLKGLSPIICRISIEGEEDEEISLGKKVHENDWNSNKKRAKGGFEAQEANDKIEVVSRSSFHCKYQLKNF